MEDRFCKKCNKVCHCTEEDRSDCECENCECMQREEDKTYEYKAKIGPEPKSVSQLLQEGMELQRRLEEDE